MNYDRYFTDTVKKIKPSGIRKFFDAAAIYKDVVSLGVGEPDFDTPWTAREAAIRSIRSGFTHYTANSGLLKLREAISDVSLMVLTGPPNAERPRSPVNSCPSTLNTVPPMRKE